MIPSTPVFITQRLDLLSAEARNDLWRLTRPRGTMRRQLGSPEGVLAIQALVEGGLLVGWATVGPPRGFFPRQALLSVFVAPAYRRVGVGLELARRATAALPAGVAPTVLLPAGRGPRRAARALFERAWKAGSRGF